MSSLHDLGFNLDISTHGKIVNADARIGAGCTVFAAVLSTQRLLIVRKCAPSGNDAKTPLEIGVFAWTLRTQLDCVALSPDRLDVFCVTSDGSAFSLPLEVLLSLHRIIFNESMPSPVPPPAPGPHATWFCGLGPEAAEGVLDSDSLRTFAVEHSGPNNRVGDRPGGRAGSSRMREQAETDVGRCCCAWWSPSISPHSVLAVIARGRKLHFFAREALGLQERFELAVSGGGLGIPTSTHQRLFGCDIDLGDIPGSKLRPQTPPLVQSLKPLGGGHLLCTCFGGEAFLLVLGQRPPTLQVESSTIAPSWPVSAAAFDVGLLASLSGAELEAELQSLPTIAMPVVAPTDLGPWRARAFLLPFLGPKASTTAEEEGCDVTAMLIASAADLQALNYCDEAGSPVVGLLLRDLAVLNLYQIAPLPEVDAPVDAVATASPCGQIFLGLRPCAAATRLLAVACPVSIAEPSLEPSSLLISSVECLLAVAVPDGLAVVRPCGKFARGDAHLSSHLGDADDSINLGGDDGSDFDSVVALPSVVCQCAASVDLPGEPLGAALAALSESYSPPPPLQERSDCCGSVALDGSAWRATAVVWTARGLRIGGVKVAAALPLVWALREASEQARVGRVAMAVRISSAALQASSQLSSSSSKFASLPSETRGSELDFAAVDEASDARWRPKLFRALVAWRITLASSPATRMNSHSSVGRRHTRAKTDSVGSSVASTQVETARRSTEVATTALEACVLSECASSEVVAAGPIAISKLLMLGGHLHFALRVAARHGCIADALELLFTAPLAVTPLRSIGAETAEWLLASGFGEELALAGSGALIQPYLLTWNASFNCGGGGGGDAQPVALPGLPIELRLRAALSSPRSVRVHKQWLLSLTPPHADLILDTLTRFSGFGLVRHWRELAVSSDPVNSEQQSGDGTFGHGSSADKVDQSSGSSGSSFEACGEDAEFLLLALAEAAACCTMGDDKRASVAAAALHCSLVSLEGMYGAATVLGHLTDRRLWLHAAALLELLGDFPLAFEMHLMYLMHGGMEENEGDEGDGGDKSAGGRGSMVSHQGDSVNKILDEGVEVDQSDTSEEVAARHATVSKKNRAAGALVSLLRSHVLGRPGDEGGDALLSLFFAAWRRLDLPWQLLEAELLVELTGPHGADCAARLAGCFLRRRSVAPSLSPAFGAALAARASEQVVAAEDSLADALLLRFKAIETALHEAQVSGSPLERATVELPSHGIRSPIAMFSCGHVIPITSAQLAGAAATSEAPAGKKSGLLRSDCPRCKGGHNSQIR